MDNSSIRVIYDYNLKKMINQYEQIKSIIPNHSLFVYNNQSKVFPKSKYNIYFDTVSENVFNILPTVYTVLIVNDEYVTYLTHLRRENYTDKPLLLLDDYVDYYICLTKYSYDILVKIKKIPKKKVIYLNGLTSDLSVKSPDISNKMILYDIDIYSGQNNYLILDTWIKYFLDRPEKLIIKYYYEKDYVVEYFKELINLKRLDQSKTYFYKNIILTKDVSSYENNIYAVIINSSLYELAYKLYENILKKRIIITNKNPVSDEIIKNKDFLLTEYNEDNVRTSLNKLFNNDGHPELNYKNLSKNIKSTLKKISKFDLNMTENIVKNIGDVPIIVKPVQKSIDEQIYLVNKYHYEVIKDNKFINMKPVKQNLKDYFRILKEPSKKTEFAYSTTIFCDNKFLNLILTTGYTLKHIAKTKYNIVCLVQDRPYTMDDVYFPGLSEDEINDIKKIYDCVIGIDLLHSNIDKVKYYIQYKNIVYYSTKVLCIGLTQYKKILFYDASSLISSNIDHIFKDYDKATYYNMYQFVKCKRGLVGNLILITPKQKYFDRAIYLVNNFNTILEKPYNHYTNDEDIIYYSIYPDWNNKILDDSLFSFNYHRYPNIIMDINKKKNIYDVQFYVQLKPMRYSLKDDSLERSLFTENNSCYNVWDLCSARLLVDFPEFIKYYDYIKTYRYNNI